VTEDGRQALGHELVAGSGVRTLLTPRAGAS
jgi:hypothetical protein